MATKSVRRRRGRDAGGTARGAPKSRSGQEMPRWRWRTFPVFAAFVGGFLLASLISGQPDNDFTLAVRIAALFAAGYILAHFFVVKVVAPRRTRGRDARDRGDEWVDEVVYPDDVVDDR